MLFDSQSFEYGIKLWAVTDLFSGFLESWIRCHIETIYCDFSLWRLDFTSQAFKTVSFTCTRNAKKCKTFSILKSEGYFFNSSNFTISFFDVVNSNRQLLYGKLGDPFLFNTDPIVLIKFPKGAAIIVQLVQLFRIDPLLPVCVAETSIFNANEKEDENWYADTQGFKIWSCKWIIVRLEVVLLYFGKFKFH